MFIKNCIWSWQKVRVVIKRSKGEIKRHLLLERKAMTNLVSVLKSRDIKLYSCGRVVKKQRHHFSNKGPYGQSYGSHVWMWELDQKECWALKNWNITLPTNVHLVKAVVLPVVMYGSESWTIKKAEYWRMMLLNCGAGKDFWESLGLQGDPTSPS